MVKCQRDFTMVQWPIGRERKQNPQPEPWLAACGNKWPLWRQWEDKMKKKMLSLLLCGCLAASALAGCGKASEEEVVTNTDAEDAAEEAAADAEDTEEAADAAEDTAEAASDMEYVLEKGTLLVGITNFEPMDYMDENGEWIGFDADLANAFAESLGIEAEFVEIEWDSKIMELDSSAIDCVWNGMTLTDEVTSSMECTDAYLHNAQVVVVPADVAEDYQDVESLSGLTFAVEAGSAGEAEVSALGLDYIPVSAQSDALLEVASGTSDAAVIDLLMAAAMIGEGTGYDNLTYTVSLNNEEYGVGFRKGSDLTAALNDFFAAAYEDGTMQETAEKYGVQAALIGADAAAAEE